MNHVTRFNLKTACSDRSKLIDFCLKGKEQFLAIGWSYIYKKSPDIKDYESYYNAIRSNESRMNHALNVFRDVNNVDANQMFSNRNNLFWTRDLDGYYWICSAIDRAISKCDTETDIGAIVPIKAFKVGLDVPGQIKASFNRPQGGTAQSIYNPIILEYSKYIYNKLSGENIYEWFKIQGDMLDNLPDFDLEELVISYLQVMGNYYVLSNSIANKSTTVKIECELRSRDPQNNRKAVVQVKGGKEKSIDALDYKEYADDGYIIYLYAPKIDHLEQVKDCVKITREDLHTFYNAYTSILPESVTRWNDLFI